MSYLISHPGGKGSSGATPGVGAGPGPLTADASGGGPVGRPEGEGTPGGGTPPTPTVLLTEAVVDVRCCFVEDRLDDLKNRVKYFH